MALVKLGCLVRWCQKQVLGGGGGPGASCSAYANDVAFESLQPTRQGRLLRPWPEHFS